MTLSTLESWKFWSDILAVGLALATAAAGVLALYFGVRVSAMKDAEANRFRDESRVAIAAADARAAEAREKAATAEQGTAKAVADAAEANRLAESFRLDIAQANERAASANETAERERLARLQLEARLAPRALTPTQQQSIGSALKKFGVLTVQVFTCSDVAEVGQIGSAVTSSMGAAGWRVAVAKVMGGNFTVTGIALALAKDAPSSTRKAAEALVAELQRDDVSSAIVKESIDDIQKAIAATFGSTVEHPDLFVLIGNK